LWGNLLKKVALEVREGFGIITLRSIIGRWFMRRDRWNWLSIVSIGRVWCGGV
jgi:hypothetical protein